MGFDEALRFTMGVEGGYSNHPDDKGGATNYGISSWTFNRAQELGIIESDIESVRDITRRDAEAIYREMFWNDQYAGLNDVDSISRNLGIALFDFSVHSSRENAVRELQTLLGFDGSDVDGIVGSKTLEAIKNYEGNLVMDYINAREAFLDRLGEAEPEQGAAFGDGWRNRLNALSGIIWI